MDDIYFNLNITKSLSSSELLYNENELRCYLGIKGNEQFSELDSKIKFLADEIRSFACPRVCYRLVEVKREFDRLILADISINSRDLYKNLLNCENAIIFSATLGVGVDRLIKKYLTKSCSEGVIANAIASAHIEGLCDSFNKEIEDRFGFLNTRYSCGYGDFDISYQSDILNLLDAGKNIGVFCTDKFLLIPSKSVTAIIGIKKGTVDEDIRSS